MTKTKIVPLAPAALFAVILVSCNLFTGNEFNTLGDNSFYAQNMETGKFYKVEAEMLYPGKSCMIWAEKSAQVSLQTARDIAQEYDVVIRPKVVNAFSKKDFNVTNRTFSDMLDYANWLVGRDDKKLTILLLDIKDGFKDPATDSYVAGYFFGGNFFQKGAINGAKQYSNGRDMIYIDTYPGLEMQPQQTYTTFAHELQHLINFVTSVQIGRKSTMDTWIDEGLSSQAEYLYQGENPGDKCAWFVTDREGTIANGNNFFVWDNHKEKSLAILDDYATVYLFFRWLYLQANQELQPRIFLNIEISSYHNYQAVTAIAQQINPAWNTWEDLLRTWLAANYDPENVNYGYKNDSYLQKNIKVKPIAGRPTILLYPGEGVYSNNTSNSFVPEKTSAHIRYAGLTKNVTVIDDTPPYAGSVLLTFNANTSNTAAHETGYLSYITSVSPPASRMAAENTQTENLTGPYILDARDMLNKTKR